MKFILLSAILCPLIAFAGGGNDHPAPKPQPHGDVLLQPHQSQGQGQTQSQNAKGGTAVQGQSDVSSSLSKSAASSNSAGGTASASGGQGGASNSGGNNYTSSDSIPRQTPPAFAGSVEPTASCKNARNAGASSPVAGISFGISTTDDECDLRETARLFFEMGQPALGVELLCKSKAANRLSSCAYAAPAVATTAGFDTRHEPVDAVTHSELQEVEKRMLQRGVGK